MSNNQPNETMIPKIRMPRSLVNIGFAALLGLAWIPIQASPPDRFQQVNLVSDQPGVALLQDTNLVNAWGISFSATSPFWISDNGTGMSTLYAVTNDAAGIHVVKQALEVVIPGEGNPTGQVLTT